jgi:hypothetical protein
MSQNLFESISFTRIHHQYFPNQILSSLISEVLREIKLPLYYFLVSLIDLIGFKWSLTHEHDIDNNSGTPNIYLIGMPRVPYTHASLDNFGSNVVGSSADCMFSIAIKLYLSS